MFRNKNCLSFRELCDRYFKEYDYLIFLFDVLSPAPFPKKYYNDKIDLDWDTLYASATNTLVVLCCAVLCCVVLCCVLSCINA